MTTMKASAQNANANSNSNVSTSVANVSNEVLELHSELAAKRANRNAANAKRQAKKEANTKKEASKETVKVNPLSIAKANTKKAQKEANKAVKEAVKEADKNKKANIRSAETETKQFILNEHRKLSKQWTILCQYIMSGCMDNLLVEYNISTKKQKQNLIDSVSTLQLYSVARYVSVVDGKARGILVNKKVILRAETDENCELYTKVLCKKTTYTLSDLIMLFQKVLRKRYNSGLTVKSDKIAQTDIEFLKDFDQLETEIVAAYKENKLPNNQIKETVK